MKIKLALLDSDQNYLNRIVTAFNIKYADKLEIYSFTKLESAMAALEPSRIDVLVASDTFVVESSALPKRCQLAYFVESADVDSVNDQRAICKFQKADLIYRQILSIYSEYAGSASGLKLGDDSCKVIAFTSPCGGVGSSTMAAACALHYAARGKRTLYLNFERFGSSDAFFAAEGQFDMSGIIFALKSKKTNLSMKMESCVKQDPRGVYFYSQSKVALDMLELGADEIGRLISEARLSGNYEYVIADLEFGMDRASLQILRQAGAIVWTGDGSEIVSYSDTNYDDAQVNITLTGAMRKGVALDGSYADQHNGKVFTFKNFAKEKEVDDIYTLAATLTDKAGNTTEKTILFSANRFGSTYALSAATEQLNGSYVQTPQDVVVTETNPDALQNIRITLFKNNQTIILQEGTDYRIEVRGGNGQWYEYIYTVLAKNFADDGVYRLTFYSEDAAGNIAENTLDTKKQEIGFGVDKTKPNMVVTNLESDTTYPLENLTVSLSAGDNLLLQSVVVYLDDYSKAYKTWTAEEVAAIVADQGEFTFDIPGDSTGAHQVKIVCTDAAGNEQTEEITNFYVTTNLFVRYYNNKPLFFGSIAAVVVIAGVVIALAAGKKKKNDKEK